MSGKLEDISALAVPQNIEICADTFADITQGYWVVHPSIEWRFSGLCWHWDAYKPKRVVVAKSEGFRYGVDVSSLKADMIGAGVIVDGGSLLPKVAVPLLRVDSVPEAIRKLASYLRSNTKTPVVAVTGSVGKTSSCRLLCNLLGYAGRVTTNGQFNYADGIVCEMGNLAAVDFAVIEASLQGLGEATTILKPHVAVLTQITPGHLDQCGSLLDLAKKKARLFSCLPPGGAAIINRDVPYFDHVLEIARAADATVVTFGEHADADFHLSGYDASVQCVRARILGEDVDYKLGMRGRHMAINSLGALAATRAVGADWRSVLPRCASAQSVTGRGKQNDLEIAGVRISVIDDTYNASPAAMMAAFELLAASIPKDNGRRIAVLSDMLELGDDSERYHRKLAVPLLDAGVEKVYLAGMFMSSLWDELPEGKKGFMSKKTSELLHPLVRNLRNGDVILLKGSHSTEMYNIAADLRYLSFLPNLQGASLPIYIAANAITRRMAPYIPSNIRRRIAWQFEKFMNKRRLSDNE